MKRALTVVWALCLLISASAAQAQGGASYQLTWTSIDAGGGSMSGGGYSLTSSIGQPDAGATQCGGGYSLNGGVVDAGKSGDTATGGLKVYVPLILR